MGIKRVIDTDFWNDDKVIERFTPEDKLFFLYLMTNPHTTQLGVYAINIKHMAFELGYSQESVQSLLERFENKYEVIRYSYDTREIAIKNYLKYSIVKGGKPVEDLLKREISKVKDKSLLQFVYENINDFENLNETVKTLLPLFNIKEKENEDVNVNDNVNDNDNDVSYHDSCHDSSKEIIQYLNMRTGSKFRDNISATNKHIKARLKEGFTLQDFKTVIDKKCAEWMGTDMQQYLRPQTLFGTKFESYLNQQVNHNRQRTNNGNFVLSNGKETSNIFVALMDEEMNGVELRNDKLPF